MSLSLGCPCVVRRSVFLRSAQFRSERTSRQNQADVIDEYCGSAVEQGLTSFARASLVAGPVPSSYDGNNGCIYEKRRGTSCTDARQMNVDTWRTRPMQL